MNKFIAEQRAFQKYLLNNDLDFIKNVVSTDEVPAERRLSIYQDAYFFRLIDALASNFPALNKYLGTDQFTQMARDYIAYAPSIHRSIRWYGDKLALFLLNHADYKSFPYLSEIAELEWSMTLAFDAKDDSVLQIEEMMQVPATAWIDMKLQFQSALQRHDFFWNTLSIVQAILNDETPPEPLLSDQLQQCIIWRTDYDVRFCLLNVEEAFAIDEAARGVTFGEICEGLCEWMDEENAGIYAASLLKGWIQSGLITHIIYDGESKNA